MYNFLGVSLKSPIIIGSSPITYSAEAMIKLSNAGAGAVVCKTIRKEKAINPAPHMVRNSPNSLINNELWTDFDAERWIEKEIPLCKKNGVKTIASLGHTLEETSVYAPLVEKAGADFIELVSYDKDDLIPMIKDAKSKVSIPIIAKLPSSVPNIGDFAKKLEDAGADAITACDSVGPAFRIDIETAKPFLGGSGYGWISGDAIKAITLHKIYEIKKKVSIPIIGLGGCTSGNDALEMIMAGASMVGLCSIVILKGDKVINKVIDDLNKNLSRLSYNSIADACFAVHKNMDKEEETSFEFVYDEDKCTKCKQCENVCSYFARTINDEMKLDEKECRYCGLCISVCPTKALRQK